LALYYIKTVRVNKCVSESTVTLMKNLQKIGGVGALLLAASSVLLLVFIFVILPSFGLAEEDSGDLAKILPLLTNPFGYFPALSNLIYAISLLFIVLALDDRLHAGSPALMRIATTAGLTAIILFVANSMIDFHATFPLAQVYPQNPAEIEAAYRAVAVVLDGVVFGAIFALGWWLLLLSWTVLRTGTLPQGLGYLGLVMGVASVATIVIEPLQIITLVGGVIWGLWVGMVLLREPTSMPKTAQTPA
jgi:hypothetical protein